jgi:Flp pilus assembly protein TadD
MPCPLRCPPAFSPAATTDQVGKRRGASSRPVPTERPAGRRELWKWLVIALIAVVLVYSRTFGAGFVEFDDDIHVYANPMLNPLSLESVGKLWTQPYQGLYIPLAYTIMGGVALFARTPAQLLGSINRVVTLSPGPFHVASVAFHLANTLLCFLLALRLTRSRTAASVCSFIFALHPLQVESVGWISELRGLSCASFGLAALDLFVRWRQASARTPARAGALLALSGVFLLCAVLCKPAAIVLPLVAFAVDRVALRTSWRRSSVIALAGMACVLPLALVTRSVQDLHPEGASLWWQRPFVAGDALAFYLSKAALPINLGVEYGRTPPSVMSHGWSYLVWAIPVGLLVFAYVNRRRRPIAWLGSLVFVAFLLPTLGLVPFSFQAHSTVADRYVYLALIGLGLVVADVVSAVPSNIAVGAVAVAIVLLGIQSFHQSGSWVDNAAFLRHTLDVNPDVAFAHNNLGGILLKEKRPGEAIDHFEKTLELEPRNVLAENNLGLALVQLGRLDEAEAHFRKAVELNPSYVKAYESLGAVYLQTDRLEAAIASLRAAVNIQPSEARALNDLGIAFMRSGRAQEGIDAFHRAVNIEPSNRQYRGNLGRALLQVGQSDEARSYLGE